MRKRLSVEQRRNDILQAAQTLFRQHGYAAVQIDMIRNAAGLSRGGFYHHFAAKTDILAEFIDAEVTALMTQLAATQTTGAGALHAIIRHGAVHAGNDPGIVSTLTNRDDRALYLSYLDRSLQNHLRPQLVRAILDGIAAGEFSAIPADHAADLFLCINAQINRNELLEEWSPCQSRAFARTALKALGLLLESPMDHLISP